VGILRRVYSSPLARVPFVPLGASGMEAGTAFPELARRGDPDRFHYLEVLVLELDVPFAPKVSKSAVVLWPGSLS
jgi:hypothetical protein